MTFVLRTRAALLGAAALLAAAPAAAQELPPAAELVDRYVEAIGGRDAVLSPESSRTKGTFEIAAAGLSGELEVVSIRPNRTATTVTIPGMGVIRSGFDGTHGWSMDPMMGARLMSGAELESLREQANPLASLRDPSVFPTRETVERTEMGGQPCYRVRLVAVSGRETFDCYHVDSGLLVGQVATQESPMGSNRVTTHLSDYREFGGVMMPTRVVQDLGAMQQVLTIQSVEFGSVAEAELAPPAEIHALMGH
jgi:hypothetical protein